MGRYYCGPYAEQVGEHEGYGMRLLPDGRLTANWTAETEEFVAYLAACECGWMGVNRHPPTYDGEFEAVDEWDRVHLQPLVVAAVEHSWATWASEVGAAATEVAGHVGAARLSAALDAMKALIKRTEIWAHTLERLSEGATSARLEDWN